MVPLGPAMDGTVKQTNAVARIAAMAALRSGPRVDEQLNLFIMVCAMCEWMRGWAFLTESLWPRQVRICPPHLGVAAERDPRMVARSNGVPDLLKPVTNVTRFLAPRRVGGIHAAKARWLVWHDR